MGFILVVGILAAIATNIPYANWYGFPKPYTLAQLTIMFVNFLLVGIVAGLMMRPKSAEQV